MINTAGGWHELASRFNVNVVEAEGLQSNGYYSPDLRVIFINPNLSEKERRFTMLHELMHVIDTEPNAIKQEADANRFMISAMIDDYLNETGKEIKEVSYVEFMEAYKLTNEELVKEIITSKCE
ncbi:ImmA/IrrE family metallo-endopeptidase [Limosilactobacillus equigenerosi]|uniref:ImmA/IrrE family metallo-endopeptidase n=1 Tax=Limosilactobacillus equigenerosi TaxID=417373 RepID=UPI0006D1D58F|nr:ImmA/IrrE family metallo-endopeptidase [Limosilactobacillus equigenerosi]